MNKYLVLILFSFSFMLFSACSSDDEPSEYSVMVNVDYNGSLASPSLVRLYDYEDAKNFNNTYDGVIHYGIYHELINDKGEKIIPRYTSDVFVGVNTFTNVSKGRYIAIVMYKPSGFTYENFFYYAYKVIEVNSNNNAKLYKCSFTYDSPRGEWINF